MEKYESSSNASVRKTSSVNEKGDVHVIEGIIDDAEANFSNDEVWDEKLSPADEEIVNAHIEDRNLEEALEILRQAAIQHRHDITVPPGKKRHIDKLISGPGNIESLKWEREVKFQAFLIKDWSIYPEVRAVTAPIAEEEPHDPETLRVYVLGLIWGLCATCLDTFFTNRFPGIGISSLAVQILVSATGRFWSRFFITSIPLGFGKRFTINPGPWTYKEQLLSQNLMSVAVGAPFQYLTITAQANDNFYGFDGVTFGYLALLTFSTQFWGFGIAGLLRSFLVYPEECVWYGVLPTLAYCRTLSEPEKRERIRGWSLKRWELLAIVSVLIFIWYWITNFLFSALSYFDWLAWIAPNNVNLQAFTGFQTGLGLNPWPTFDPNIAGTAGMVTPFWSSSASITGLFISFFAVVIIWYTNVRWTAYLPINSNSLFNNRGGKFKVAKILGPDNLLDEKKYQSYSPPFYSAGNLVNYGANFMLYPATFVYGLLNYGESMLTGWKIFAAALFRRKNSLEAYTDRFTVAQRRHKEVPEWWFLIILVIGFGLAVATVEHYKFTQTPVWTLILGAALGLVFIIPSGIMSAQASFGINVNALIELMIGYALPGNGNAVMVSKLYATLFFDQAENYLTNQKQIHYANIAPRSLFRVQIISVICNTWVQLGLMWWQLNGGIKNMCDPDNRMKFTCQDARIIFNAGVQWGTIGPKRVFDGVYPQLKWVFLIGAVFPIPFWVARKFVGPFIERNQGKSALYNRLNSVRRLASKINVNEIVVLGGATGWAPSNISYQLPGYYLAIFFNFFVRRRYFDWWAKYNYVLSMTVGIGSAYAGLIMFFSTQYKHEAGIDWWGNNIPFTIGDAAGLPRLPIPDQGYFGPAPGHYP